MWRDRQWQVDLGAAALLLLALPAHAGDTAGAALWEPQGRPVVIVEAVLGRHDMAALVAIFDNAQRVELPPGQWCGINVTCGDGHETEPAPVPLPWSGTLLLGSFGALALLWGIKK